MIKEVVMPAANRQLSDLRPHTVNVDDELWLAAVRRAEEERKSISQIINDAMREYLLGTHRDSDLG